MTNEELVIRIKAEIDVSENMLQLWQQTKDFIHTIALHYQGYADIEDLEQEGYLALYDAVDGFKSEQGCKFLTYAKYWIRLRMNRYINDCCQPVRIPSHEQTKIQEYRKMVNAFQVYLGRKPTRWEVLHNIHLNEGQMKELEKAMGMVQVVSLDSSLADGEDEYIIGDMVPCEIDVESFVLDNLEDSLFIEMLHKEVSALSGMQPEVIKLRYMEGKTIRETGKTLGLTISKVRVIEFKALQELRQGSRLDCFLPEWMESQAYQHNGVREFNRTWESSTERLALKQLKKCH